jgi:hypothetical protein
MKRSRRDQHESEPLGIIISNGQKAEEATVFRAYVWGPAPEGQAAAEEHKAA